MGVTATDAAKKNKLRITREWKANARIESNKFKASEQMSRDKYNEFTKQSRTFARAYPNEFKLFLLARSKNMQAPRQSFGPSRHMPEVVTTPVTQLPNLRPMSSSSSGSVPSAAAMEAKRLPQSDVLNALGIRLD
jgi:hypothetical protein